MHLTLSPQMGLPGQPETTIHIGGDVITIDGIAYDLSPVPEGGEGEWPDSPIIGPIRRIAAMIHATVLVRLGETATDDQAGPWLIETSDGEVTIPAVRRPEPESVSDPEEAQE